MGGLQEMWGHLWGFSETDIKKVLKTIIWKLI
jgi:hypothetical protein